MLDVGAAVGAVYIGQRSLAPPCIEREHALLGFILACVPRRNIGEIDRQNTPALDRLGFAVVRSQGTAFAGVEQNQALSCRH